MKLNNRKVEKDEKQNSNLLFRTIETPESPHRTRVFRFLENYSSTSVPKKYTHFKPARLIKGKRWYVEYYYRIPAGLEGANTWKRFRVFEDINRTRTKTDREYYSQELLKAVQTNLEIGWSPFDEQKKQLDEPAKVWTISQALHHFLMQWEKRGLAVASMAKYTRSIKKFVSWLTVYNLQNVAAGSIITRHIEQYLDETKKLNDWSNRTYNNEMDFLDTAFGFLTSDKEKIIATNPVAGIYQPKTASKKHRYYDQKTLDKLVAKMKEQDPYLYFAFQCVYHLCVRSEKELKHLKVGNIFPDRMQVLLTAGETKTNSDRYIPMSDEILRIFQERGILNANSEFYVFGVPHKNKWVPDGMPGPDPFGNGFFSKRFAKIRLALKLSSDFTLYGAKHTRVIHLKKDGAKDDEIMSLTGHKDFTSYSQYLRDLGVDANVEKLSQITRKI